MDQAGGRRSRLSDPRGEFPLDLTTYIFHLLAVVGRHREAQLDKLLQTLGLSLSRHRALSVIATQQPLTMSELADFCAIDRTTMTRIVDQLVEAELVERATPREDRRQVLLSLTAKGAAACRESLKAIWRHNRHLLEGLDDDRQRGAARVLESFLARLVDDPALLERLLLREVRERRRV
jgi:DNA-binding MarR family transcriptional regulator